MLLTLSYVLPYKEVQTVLSILYILIFLNCVLLIFSLNCLLNQYRVYHLPDFAEHKHKTYYSTACRLGDRSTSELRLQTILPLYQVLRLFSSVRIDITQLSKNIREWDTVSIICELLHVDKSPS